MKPLLSLFALLVLAGCALPPSAVISPQEEKRRDAEHAAWVQEWNQQQYWEWERGGTR
jgi:hypothetical protein